MPHQLGSNAVFFCIQMMLALTVVRVFNTTVGLTSATMVTGDLALMIQLIKIPSYGLRRHLKVLHQGFCGDKTLLFYQVNDHLMALTLGNCDRCCDVLGIHIFKLTIEP